MRLFMPAMLLRQMRARHSFARHFSCSTKYGHNVSELDNFVNHEMGSIFGEPCAVESRPPCPLDELLELEEDVTHVDPRGLAKITGFPLKKESQRVALAGCKVLLGRKGFDLFSSNQIAEGDVLSVAKMAGINGAKKTSTLIPHRHKIVFDHIRVDLALNDKDFSVDIEGEVAATGATSVEMEAMTAVTVAGLTVCDMCRDASEGFHVMDIRLEHKSGGKSGN